MCLKDKRTATEDSCILMSVLLYRVNLCHPRSRGRVSANQTSETKICVHKFACANVTHTKKRKVTGKFTTRALRHE